MYSAGSAGLEKDFAFEVWTEWEFGVHVLLKNKSKAFGVICGGAGIVSFPYAWVASSGISQDVI